MDSPKTYQGTKYLCRHTYYSELNNKKREQRAAYRAARRDMNRDINSALHVASHVASNGSSPSASPEVKKTAFGAAVHTEASRRDSAARKGLNFELLCARLRDNKRIDGVINRAAAWLEVDDKACRVERRSRRLPVGVMAVMLCVALSLMLIVAGAVVSSKANMELYAAENRLEELKVSEAELCRRLELKNDLRYIEAEARGRLGMIDRQHASVIVLDDGREDKVEINRRREGRTAFSSLLSALGFFGE